NIPLQAFGSGRTGSIPGFEKIGKSESSARRIKTVCKEMESLFVQQLLKEMRSTVQKSGLCGGGKAEEMFTSLMDSELARELSEKGGGIGLASMLETQLIRQSRKAYTP
ncbi:MAG: rod-binding protein, partial [Desulfatirhabdiaceae bacterium]